MRRMGFSSWAGANDNCAIAEEDAITH